MRLEKIIIASLALGSLLGCKTNETPQTNAFESGKFEIKGKKLLDIKNLKAYLDYIAKTNNIPYLKSIQVYEDQNEQEFRKYFYEKSKNQKFVDVLVNRIKNVQDEEPFFIILGPAKKSTIIACPALRRFVNNHADLESMLVFYAGHRIKDYAEEIVLEGYGITREINKNKVTKQFYLATLAFRSIVNYMIETKKTKAGISQQNKAAILSRFITLVNYFNKESNKGSIESNLVLEDAERKIYDCDLSKNK